MGVSRAAARSGR